MNKITTANLRTMKKEGTKITVLTCYSYSIARVMAQADIDVILVGDSLGMVELGYKDTIPVTVDEMIHHTKAVARAKFNSLLVTDMPFMSYNIEQQETLRAAGRLMKEGGAEAVKLEGGCEVAATIRYLVENNVAVMGHLGLTPQSVHALGGYKVQGKTESSAAKLLEDAKSLEQAGVFALVLEAIPVELAKKVSESISIPTIGIGAGPYCDGQVLVVNDMIGLDLSFKPRFVKRYLKIEEQLRDAFNKYSSEVRSGKFPSEDESYK